MDIDLTVLRMMEREKEIPFDELVQIIEQAILMAYLKHTNPGQHGHANPKGARAHLDRKRLVQRDQVNHLLSRLNDRERLVLSAHFGLDDADDSSTYEQVGQRLGISKERVRQIEQNALAKLRAAAGIA